MSGQVIGTRLRLPTILHQRLQRRAAREGRSLHNLMIRLLDEAVASERGEGMTQERLAALIREHGVRRMGDVVGDFAQGFVAGIKEGWDLSNWGVQTVGGAALFYQTARVDEGAPVITNDPTILVVNAPESARARWEALARETNPGRECLVIMQEA